MCLNEIAYVNMKEKAKWHSDSLYGLVRMELVDCCIYVSIKVVCASKHFMIFFFVQFS